MKENSITFFKKTPPKSVRSKSTDEFDPLRLTLRHRVFTQGLDDHVLKVVPGATDMVLSKEDIIFVDGKADALVLFDRDFIDVEVAPLSVTMYPLMRVHLFGFSEMEGHTSFIVPGEVMSISRDYFRISNHSIPGLSGSAIVYDQDGGVVGYCGGCALGKDKSPFGAYAYPLSYVVKSVLRADDSKKSSSTDSDEQTISEKLTTK